MIPGVAADELAKGLKEGLKDLKPVTREILEQFGISKDDDYQGLIPLAILLYGPSKDLLKFLKNMLIIQHQIMSYLDGLGASLSDAVSTVENPTVGIGGTVL